MNLVPPSRKIAIWAAEKYIDLCQILTALRMWFFVILARMLAMLQKTPRTPYILSAHARFGNEYVDVTRQMMLFFMVDSIQSCASAQRWLHKIHGKTPDRMTMLTCRGPLNMWSVVARGPLNTWSIIDLNEDTELNTSAPIDRLHPDSIEGTMFATE